MMMRQLLQYLLYTSRPIVLVNIAFFIVLFLVRCYELALIGGVVLAEPEAAALIVAALTVDLFAIGVLMVVVSLLYFLLLSLFGIKTAVRLHMVLMIGMVFGAIALSRYFSVTLIPLSTDLYGYSLNDIVETVGTSGGMNFGEIAVLIVAAAALFFIPAAVRNLPLPKFLVYGFYLFALCSIPTLLLVNPAPGDFSREVEYNIVVNKPLYFIGESFGYFTRGLFDSEEEEGGGIAADNTRLEFPLLKNADSGDVIGPYFTVRPEKPNIVIIIVEGLGSDFVEGGTYQGFTPFIDSLARRSLTWKNFLSTTGRTFGVLPSITASLPLHGKGFMELGEKMPDHQSLFTILKENGYRTGYFYGGKIDFDNQSLFLERQKVDRIVSEKDFPTSYEKAPPAEGGFTWGYTDGDLFRFSLEVIGAASDTPRFDVYMTITTHEPFVPPDKEYYLQLFNRMLSGMDITGEKRTRYVRNKEVFSTLLYTDHALRRFFHEYEKRADFGRTIFVITGDHRLIPVPFDSKIDRYRVPFILYSPMISRPEVFYSVSTHADVPPTVLGFLKHRFGLTVPEQVHWVGMPVDTARQFRNLRSRLFMPYKGNDADYLDGNYFVSEDRIFNVYKNLSIEETNNEAAKDAIRKKQDRFRAAVGYAVANNALFPNGRNVAGASGILVPQIREPLDGGRTKREIDSLYAVIDSWNMNSDQLFFRARDTAFAGFYRDARLICRRLLERNPDYHDVRTLLARVYSWDQRFDEARNELLEVIRRAPRYSDAYNALAYVEFWSDNNTDALKYITRSIELNPDDLTARLLRARLNFAQHRDAEAAAEVDDILNRNPHLTDAIALKKKIESATQQ